MNNAPVTKTNLIKAKESNWKANIIKMSEVIIWNPKISWPNPVTPVTINPIPVARAKANVIITG